ncbi:MAG: ABC transporter ATP-binding protein/permease [Erysipelotrichaceae bacterium]|jgi:ATP-binding cassette subfamily B protein|nr:ABC transporter ATP-binding protein/permease [Erysipelotrichaceae bacterium]
MSKFREVFLVETNGVKKRYFLGFAIMLVAVFLMVISLFTSLILIDTLTGDIITNPEKSGPIAIFIANLLGGPEFLSQNYWVFAVVIVILGISRALTLIARHTISGYVYTKAGKNMQLMMFDHIENLPYHFLKKAKSGDIIQTCTRDEEVLRFFIGRQVFIVAYTIEIVLFSFILLASVSLKLALISIIIIPVIFIYSVILIKYLRKLYRIADDAEGELTAKIEENLASIRLVKAYNNEQFEIKEFDRKNNDYRQKMERWHFLQAFYFSSSDILVFAQIVLSTLFAIYLGIEGEIGIGAIALSFTFVNQIVWPVRDVSNILANYARAKASLDRINILMKQPKEDTDTGVTPEIKGEIEFIDTHFKYDDATETFLQGISFRIKPGETIAIMGKTGSGKSTLANLLTRLYDPSSGKILIDGVDITTIQKNWLRKRVSIVLQEPFLFSKTIYNNLIIAQSKDISPFLIHEATDIAAIHQSILTFKDGYNTVVGEKGSTLSGGQKQRLAIARTILNEAPIMIFDDSLSAVDTETDLKIRAALKTKKRKATTLIITHRIATAKDADKIIIIDKGRISDIGTHAELIEKEGLYKTLYDIQTRLF